MASRSQFAEVVARRQVHRVRVGPIGPRRSLDLRSGRADAEEDHRPRQREGRADLDAGLEDAALHRRRQEALQLHRRRRQDRPWSSSNDIGRIGSVAVSPDSKWVAFAKQDRTLRSHVYIAPIAGGEERHISDDTHDCTPRTNAVWTADGRYIVFTSTEGFSNGIATRRAASPTTTALWVRVAARSGSRPDESRHRQRGAGPRRAGGGASAAGRRRRRAPPEVRIDWSGLARRARS